MNLQFCVPRPFSEVHFFGKRLPRCGKYSTCSRRLSQMVISKSSKTGSGAGYARYLVFLIFTTFYDTLPQWIHVCQKSLSQNKALRQCVHLCQAFHSQTKVWHNGFTYTKHLTRKTTLCNNGFTYAKHLYLKTKIRYPKHLTSKTNLCYNGFMYAKHLTRQVVTLLLLFFLTKFVTFFSDFMTGREEITAHSIQYHLSKLVSLLVEINFFTIND